MHIIAQKSAYIYPRYGKLIKNTNSLRPAVPGDRAHTVHEFYTPLPPSLREVAKIFDF